MAYPSPAFPHSGYVWHAVGFNLMSATPLVRPSHTRMTGYEDSDDPTIVSLKGIMFKVDERCDLGNLRFHLGRLEEGKLVYHC